tara:strand:- start:44780 stop:46564 length:1785 start_codon:yes stop_codon:yes gene_type:complete
LVAVDVDAYKPECGWSQFAEATEIPDTLIQRSPRGGVHYLFAAIETDHFAGVLADVPGVDIKSNGYILVAPSIVEGRSYSWETESKPAPVPDWVTRKNHVSEAKPVEELSGSSAKIRAALTAIPNPDCDWEFFNKIGMATFSASAGSSDGFVAFDQWSQKSQKYDAGVTSERWTHYFTSPPNRIGMGTLAFEANAADPTWQQLDPMEIFGGEVVQLPTNHIQQGLPVMSLASFADEVVPKLDWVVRDLIPKGYVTLCSGPGGTGKSLLGLQLQICAASKRLFLGKITEFGRTLGFYGEEDRGELIRRTDRICRSLGVDMATIGDAHSVPMHGNDAVLACWDGKRIMPTHAFQILEQAVAEVRPNVVIIDNIARVFSGDENHRMQVTQFTNLLEGLALRYDCAVLLMGHPAKATDSEYSGSTAWESAVRSRLYFGRSESGDRGPDERVLRVGKANMARTGEEIIVHYMDGAFVLDAATDPLQGEQIKRHREGQNDQIFLNCLDALASQGRNVSDSPNGKYAPRIMATMPEANGLNQNALKLAMDRLFSAGKIRAGAVLGKHTKGKPILGIARVELSPTGSPTSVPTGPHGLFASD